MSTTGKRSAKKRSPRHSREQWLSLALDFLAEDGNARLTIDRLVKALQVTKGSFYWHFRNRADFQASVIDFWDARFTQVVVDQLDRNSTPRQQLWSVMETVFRSDLARYDVAIRAWATHDATIAPLVQKVERKRFRTVRRLFAQLSFEGPELEMRTRCFVTCVSLEPAITLKQSSKQKSEHFRRLF